MRGRVASGMILRLSSIGAVAVGSGGGPCRRKRMRWPTKARVVSSDAGSFAEVMLWTAVPVGMGLRAVPSRKLRVNASSAGSSIGVMS
jgi:hypothetical protein